MYKETVNPAMAARATSWQSGAQVDWCRWKGGRASGQRAELRLGTTSVRRCYPGELVWLEPSVEGLTLCRMLQEEVTQSRGV